MAINNEKKASTQPAPTPYYQTPEGIRQRERLQNQANADTLTNFAMQSAGINKYSTPSGGSFYSTTPIPKPVSNEQTAQINQAIKEANTEILKQIEAQAQAKKEFEKNAQNIRLIQAQADFYRNKGYSDEQIAYNVSNVMNAGGVNIKSIAIPSPLNKGISPTQNKQSFLNQLLARSEKLDSRLNQPKLFFTKSERERFTYLLRKSNKNSIEQMELRNYRDKFKAQQKGINTRLLSVLEKNLIDTGVGTYSLILALRKNPIATLKSLPKSILEGIKKDLSLIKTDPLIGVAKIGQDIIIFKYLNKLGSATKTKIVNGLTRIDPRYVGEGKIGKVLNINLKNGNTAKLQIVGRLPRENIIKQLERSGKVVNVATSSQADSLLTLIRNQRVIRKPIAGEEAFNSLTKNLLKKFDEKTINKNELMQLDRLIKKQGAKGLLERSFFADPTGKIRPSRLGIIQDKTGSILDYFRNGITFRKAKPQILLFDKVKVEKFPPYFKNIIKKIKSRRALSEKEASDLLNFQLKQSGKFKPLGFTSLESEITLAPGEIIKKKGVVGVTLINGRRVPIVRTEVIKPTGRLKTLMNGLDKGQLTKREGRELAYLIKKKTGFNYRLSSLKKDTARYFSLKKLGLSSIVYASKNNKIVSGYSKYNKYSKYSPKPYSPISGRSGGSKPYSPKPYSPISGRSGGSKPYSPKPYSPISGRSGGSKPLINFPLGASATGKLQNRNKLNRFDVYIKPTKSKNNRFVKINTSPLVKTDAKDLRNYVLDTSLSRTGLIVPSRGRPGRINLNFPRGYSQRTSGKFREYRVKRGNKVILPQGKVIERTRNILDTIQEKRKIDLFRRLQQLRIKQNNRFVRPQSINRPQRLIKGSKQARLYMAKLRNMRR